MKLKGIISALVTAVALFSASAETVSQKEAKRVARLFFNDAYGYVTPDPEYVYNGKRLVTDRLFTPFYVFNSPAGGFVVISADNKAFPILGYSLSAAPFPHNHLSEEQLELLRSFSRDIELIRFDSRYPYNAAEAWENLPATIHDILYSPEILAPGYRRYRPDENSLWVLRDRAVEFPYEWPKTDLEIQEAMLAEEEAAREEEPFTFYDSFIAETAAEGTRAENAIEESLRPSRPILKNLGGAHFSVESPTEVDIVNIYNAEGALVKRIYFPSSHTLSIDLSNLPIGFYFAHFLSHSASPYGLKFYR